jgi:hypothetical protein
MSLARSPESNEAFFREVDEEVRRDQMSGLARRYGVLVGVLVLAGLLAFGGYLLWKSHTEAEAGKQGEALTAAMASVSAGNKDAARKKLAPIVADGGPAYGTLAKLTLADMQIQAGQNPQAAQAFMRTANDASAPQPLRDLALVRATALDFDRLPPAEVISRLKPLAVPGTPWFGSAGEMTGMAQMKLGQTKQAGTTFAGVARDTETPDTLRERTRQLAADLGVEVVEPASSPAIVR